MKINELHIKYRFKKYEFIVCSENGILYQLEHFKYKHTRPFKKLKYNRKRNAYRIYSQWISKNKLKNLIIPTRETLKMNQHLSELDSILKKLEITLKYDDNKSSK